MNSLPHSIVKASQADLPDILMLFASLGDGPSPESTALSNEIEDGRLYLLKEKGKLIGVSAVSHDVIGSFFPSSRSYRKSDDLLEKVGYSGEPVAVLTRLAISPFRQRKGFGSELLASLFARYKGSTWLLGLKENQLHALPFFKKRGFLSLGISTEIEGFGDNPFLLYRPYKREGLCSTAWW